MQKYVTEVNNGPHEEYMFLRRRRLDVNLDAGAPLFRLPRLDETGRSANPRHDQL